MRPNILRARLQSGKPTLGTRIQSQWPSIVEVIGHSGLFDYVEFLAEYAPYTLMDLENLARAADLHNLGSMIKVDEVPRQHIAQRAIGAGFQGVLFADVRSAEDARACVRMVRADTPEDHGLYGAATRRNAFMGYGGNQEYVRSLREIVVVLMIEKHSAVEQLEEILRVPGVDMIQWGPADYSMNVGKAGQRNDPEIAAVERYVIETGLRFGIQPRIELNTPQEAQPYLEMGVRHFSLGSELTILYRWLMQNGQTLRKTLEEA